MKRLTRFITILAALLIGATPALAQNFSSVQVLNGSCSAPSITFFNDNDTGFYLSSAGNVGVCVNGAQVATITTNGIASTVSSAPVVIRQSDGLVSVNTSAYAGATSRQALSGDLNVAAGAGTSASGGHAYLNGGMGNVILNGNMTGTKNTVTGLVGKYDITGTNASTYPKGGVVGEVGGAKAGQVSSGSDGAVIAVLGGDEGPVQSRAAFTVDFENTGAHAIGTSYFQFGLDLQGPGAHSGYMSGRYEMGFMRLGGAYNNAGVVETVADVCVLSGTAVPTDGTSGTGAAQCGAGSLYIRQSGSASKIYINGNTKASPTWKLVTSA